MKFKLGGMLLLIAALVLSSTAVLAQATTGTLTGKVLDQNNQPIPGAQVTVTSSYLQGPRGTATNLKGDFVLPYLPPGNDYKVTVEAEGFNKVIQSNVTIGLGSTASLQVTLTSGGEELTVTARPSAVSLKQTEIQTNLTSQEMDSLPVQRGYQDTLYLAPTVTNSGAGGNPSVAGSNSTDSIWLINGINTTDPVTGTFGTNLNYNFIREMEVGTGGFEAEYGSSLGGLFNVITKSGSNELHGEVYAYYTDQSFYAKRHSTDMSVAKQQPFHSYDYGADVGGPIIKDKLWYFVAFNPSLNNQHVQGVDKLTIYDPYAPYGPWNPTPAPGFTDHPYGSTISVPYEYDNLRRNWAMAGKLNYRINDKHNLELVFFSTPSRMWLNEGFDPTLYNEARMTRRYQEGYNAALKWYATWSPKVYQETSIGHTVNKLQILPWNRSGFGQPGIYNTDLSIGVGHGIGGYSYDDRITTQYQTKLTYLVGNHELKFGVSGEDIKWDAEYGYTGGYEMYLYYNYTPVVGLPYNPLSPNINDYQYWQKYWDQNPATHEKSTYYAAFAQDKWSITDYLSLYYGIRWEQNKIEPQHGQDLTLDDWSPRVGLSWDFMHNGKSKFYMNWGLYYQRLPMGLSTGMDGGHASFMSQFNLGSKQFTSVTGGTPTTVVPGTKPTYNKEFVTGIDYELKPNLTVGFRAQWRELGRLLEDVGYITPQGGMSYFIMNPGTSQWPAQMSNWSKIDPNTGYPYLQGYTNFPRPIRNYQAYTLSLQKRFSNRWFLNVFYTWSQLRGNYESDPYGYGGAGGSVSASTAYDIPDRLLTNNAYGLLAADVTHNLKVQGSYKFDMGLTLGAVFNFRSGRPLSKVTSWPYNPTFGYGTIYLTPRGSEGRLPSVWSLDLHAEYDFKVWKTDLAFFADIFNVTNNQVATSKYQTYYRQPYYYQDISKDLVNYLSRDHNYGKTTARQAPRYARVGVKWTF